MAEVKVVVKNSVQGSRDVQQEAQRWKQFTGTVETASKFLGAAAAGAALAWKTLGQGAELELARSRFENLAASIGTTADALENQLGQASRGMTTNAEDIASASQIISLGLADNQKDVVDLATLVSQLGWDMNQVILTFANNSKMRLDALGLSVTGVEDRMAALEAQGYDTDKAFDLAVIQAGQAKLELLGGAADTTAGGMERLKNRIIDAKNGLLEFIAVRSGPALEGLANYMDAVDVAQTDMNEAVRKGIITQEEANTIVSLAARGHDQWQDRLREVRGELDKQNDTLEDVTRTANAYYIGMGQLAEAERAHAMTIADVNYHQEEAYEGMVNATAVLEANRAAAELARGEYEMFAGTIQSYSTTVAGGYGAAALAAEDSQARQEAANAAISESYKQTAVDVFQAQLGQTVQEDGLAAAQSLIAYQEALGLITPEEAGKLEEVAIKTEAIKTATEGLFNTYNSDGVLTREEMEKMAEAVQRIDDGTVLMSQSIIDAHDEDLPRIIGLKDETANLADELFGAVDQAGELKDNLFGLPERVDVDIYLNVHGSVPDIPSSGSGTPQGYATGGVVPGPIGRPQLAVVHGGEEVLTPSQRQERGRGNITISFAGAVFQGTSADTARQIVDTVAAKLGRL